DDFQSVRFLVTDRKSVVAEDMAALSMPFLNAHHYNVKSGEFLLKLDPVPSATPRRVEAVGILDHQALVRFQPRGRERVIDFLQARNFLKWRDSNSVGKN